MDDISNIYISETKPFVFSNLSEDKRDIICERKCVLFQGQVVTLKELLTPTKYVDVDDIIDSDLLEILHQDKVIKVGGSIVALNGNTDYKYVQRKCIRDEECLSEEQLCDISGETANRVFNIYGLSDSGKTSLLDSLTAVAKRMNPYAWIIKIDLNDYRNTLMQLKRQSMRVTVQDLLNSKPDTKLSALEMKIFSITRKVILMIDGIDELYSEYRDLILDILKDSETKRNFARVFVTTSPKLDDTPLKSKSIVKYQLVPFSEEDQVNIFSKYWEKKFCPTGKRKDDGQIYAARLVSQGWMNEDKDLVGVSFQIQMLADILSTKDNFFAGSNPDLQGYIEFIDSHNRIPFLPKKFSLVELYQLFIRRNCLSAASSPVRNTLRRDVLKINEDCNNYLYVIALQSILSVEQCGYFNSYRSRRYRRDIPKEKLERLGIIKEKNNRYQFTHASLAEYFLAECIAMEYINNKSIDFMKFLFENILVQKKFALVRLFLNSFVKTDWHTISTTKVERIRSVLGHGENFKMLFFRIAAEEGNLELLRFLARQPECFKSISGMSFHEYLQQIIGETIPHIAMEKNHFHVMQYLAEQGANIQFRDDINRTLLHIAAKKNNLDAVKFLVMNKAEVDCKDSDGRTPLHEATVFGTTKMLQYLVSTKATVNRRDKAGHTALHDAVKKNSLDKVTFLLEAGAEISSTCHCDNNYYCFSPVFCAVREGNLDIVRCLLKERPCLNGRSRMGHFVLHYFTEGNHDENKIRSDVDPNSVEISELLIERGANINVVDKEGNTILHSVINGQDDVRLVKFLVESGVNLNLNCNRQGRNIFDIAVEVGAVKIVKFLMDMMKERQSLFYIPHRPSPPTGMLANSIAVAAGGGHLNVLQHLAENEVTLNVKDKLGNSPLHQAVSNNRVDVIKFLVENGVSHNYENIPTSAARNCDDDVIMFLVNNGMKTDGMLDILIEAGRLHIVRYLVEKGVKVDLVRNIGGNFELLQYLMEKNFKIDMQEVLYLAVHQGDLDIIKYLVRKGASLGELHESSNLTLLHAAVLSDQPHVVNYLLKQGLPVDMMDGLNKTALLRAVVGDCLTHSMCILIERRADVNAFDDESGNTVLCEAACKKNIDLVKLLIDCGANKELCNRSGDMVHKYALKKGALDITEYLLERCWQTTIVAEVLRITESDQKEDRSLANGIFFALESVEYLIERGFYVTPELSDRYELLIRASEAGSYKLAKQLLEMGSRVNQTNRRGFTAAHMATVFNMQKLLLKHGADMNALNCEHVSVLHHIANHGNFESFKLLVDNGGDINSIDYRRFSSLHYAADQGHYDKVLYLLAQGATKTVSVLYRAIGGDLDVVKLLFDINNYMIQCYDIMEKIVDESDLDTLKFVMKNGGIIHGRDDSQTTLLHRAVAEGRYNMAYELIMADAEINIRCTGESTPLHDATIAGDFELVKRLVMYGAFINSQDKEGNTPLHIAVKNGDLYMVMYLGEKGANLEITNSKGRTPFHEAAYGEQSDILMYLLRLKPTDIDQCDSDGNTLLHEAVEKSDVKLAQYLLTLGANEVLPTRLNKTPLSKAAVLGCVPMVELLLEYKADVHIKDNEGRTALHEATRHGNFHNSENHLKVMEALVSGGADVNAKTNAGRTPLHEAAVQCDIQKIRFLIDKGCLIDAETDTGETPLMEAVKSEERCQRHDQSSVVELVRYFIEKGARYDVTVNGRNLMHEAAAYGDKDVVVYLLELGVDIHSVTLDGSTMLHEAAKTNNINLANFLLNKGLRLDARTSDGSTPLHEATRRMMHDMMKYVGGLMVDVNLADELGRTALHVAVELNDREGFKFLVKNGADVSARDSQGRTPIECIDPDLVEWLNIRRIR